MINILFLKKCLNLTLCPGKGTEKGVEKNRKGERDSGGDSNKHGGIDPALWKAPRQALQEPEGERTHNAGEKGRRRRKLGETVFIRTVNTGSLHRVFYGHTGHWGSTGRSWQVVQAAHSRGWTQGGH